MANSKISALTSATTPLAGTETLPIVQSGATVKATVANITGAGAYPGSFTSFAYTTTLTGGTGIVALGTNQFYKDASGNIGIGTASPTSGYKLDVNGQIVISVAATAKLSWSYSGAYLNWIECGGVAGNNYMRFATGNTEVVRFTSAGNVTVALGNITLSTAAKGIDFTANTPAAGMTSQLLNWYEEGTFTPSITFATPGDLAITYSATIRVGTYTRIGNRVIVNFNVQTTAFTFTTASGALQITGLPFTSKNLTADASAGAMVWGGITKIGYTQVTPRVQPNTVLIDFVASASGLAQSSIVATDTPSGGAMTLRGTLTYEI
jgi:hypothetical protein